MPIEQQIEALESMTTEELAARYEELHGKPPRTRRPRWMQKRCAYRIQEIAYGGLSMTAKRRLEELISELDLPFGDDQEPPHTTRNGGLMVGTTLTREWHGNQVRVHVLGDGFEYDGKSFKSLSAVARHVTGTKWNGKLFFRVAKAEVAS